MRPLLCVDFDGTIYDGKGLLPGCRETLTRLRPAYRIGIFSARPTEAERNQMRALLMAFAVPFDEILERKPDAVAYIDDKGIRFEGWDKVCAYL